MEEIWGRVRQGGHVLVFGEMPTPPDDLTVVEVRCEESGVLGPIDDAHERVRGLLGMNEPRWEHAIQSINRHAIRRRMLGEVATHSIEAEFVATCNRLAAMSNGKTVLALTELEKADEATLGALLEILEHPSWLELPLVMVAAPGANSPLLRQLITVLEELHGPQAIVSSEASGEPVGTVGATEPSLSESVLEALPLDARRVLRVASVVGHSFTIEQVAQVLHRSVDECWLALQDAFDCGVPVIDRGHGTLSLPDAVREHFKAGVLPSVHSHWHRQLAASAVKPTPSESRDPQRRRGDESADSTVAWRGPLDTSPPQQSPIEDASDVAEASPSGATSPDVTEPDPYAALFVDQKPSPNPVELEENVADETPLPSTPPPMSAETAENDPVRAARHLVAAGDHAAAVDYYLEGIEQLANRGHARRAIMLIDEASRVAASIGGSPLGRLLEARVLAADGRLRWQGVGVAEEFGLARALESLDAAQALLPADAPPADVAAVAVSIAGVCADLGHVKALERALQELTMAVRVLQEAGDVLGAARLLNDQAAVYLRAGDPVRASHLLRRSREIFDGLRQQRGQDPVVLLEVAETDHMLARLPLHARVQRGRERDAVSLAMGHARAAESSYRSLGRPRLVGRVYETMGRLELARDSLETAAKRLNQAAALQRRTGDVVGLARTAAAMSDAYCAAKQPLEALALLGESVELNIAKGSPAGLAFNREAIDRMRDTISASDDPQLKAQFANRVEAIERRLKQAESWARQSKT